MLSSKCGKNDDIFEFKFKFFYRNLYTAISLLKLIITLLTMHMNKHHEIVTR